MTVSVLKWVFRS